MAEPMQEPTYYYSQINEIGGGDGVWDLGDRWREVERYADLRPDDRVLDIGSAEGLISIEVAGRVRHVHGIEISPERVEAAQRIARDRGVENVSFEAGSIVDHQPEPGGYDVVLFLGVLHHLPSEAKLPSFARVLEAAGRCAVIRTPLFDQRNASRLPLLAMVCARQNFTLTVYPQHKPAMGSLLIAERVSESA